jgi:hypothetical protein
MTRFQMTRRFLTPRVFEGPNIWERAIKGYNLYHIRLALWKCQKHNFRNVTRLISEEHCQGTTA